MAKTLLSLDVLETESLLDYELGAGGEKDIFSYLEEMRKNGFSDMTLIGFSDDEKFTARTGIKGKVSFTIAGIDGLLGSPTVAQLAIKNGGLKIPAVLKLSAKAKRTLDNAFRTYAEKPEIEKD